MRETRTATLDDADVRQAEDSTPLEFVGHAAVFDQRTWIGPPKWGFWEVVDRSFFDGVLDDPAAFLINHDPNHVLARNGNTMRLSVDAVGLVPEATWDPADPEARMWAARVKRGDVNQMSFAFTVAEDTWTEDADTGEETRTLVRAGKLYDVSLVTYPAYDGTDGAMRSQAREIVRRHRGIDPETDRPRPTADNRDLRFRYLASRRRLAR